MLIDAITNTNLNRVPENLYAVRHEEVVIDFNRSQAFLFGDNMSRFKRTVGPLCACGCGERVKIGNKFIIGHNRRGVPHTEKWKRNTSKRMLALGENHPWRSSEHRKRSSKMMKENNPMKRPEIAAKRSGDKHPMKKPEVAKKQSESLKALGENHPSKRPEVRKKNSEALKALGNKHPMRQPEIAKKVSEMFKGRKNDWMKGNNNHMRSNKHKERMKKIMLDGQAGYMSSLNQSPSRPQIKLFNKVQGIFPQAQLNYLSLNRSIDIAIPDQMIAIEYDGSYWHQDKEADEIRQKELENIGWKFLRYVDYIPTIKELITVFSSMVERHLEEK